MMRSFFGAIQWLFEEIFFALHDFFRFLELESWWFANIINWILWAIICVYIYKWTIELKKHKDNNEDEQDTTAHSFLK